MDVFKLVEKEEKELVEQLLKSGVDVNSRDSSGSTPLHWAIDIAFENVLYIYDIEKKIVQPNTEVIELLIKYGADPFLKNNEGESSLDWAKERQSNEFFLEQILKIISENRKD